MTKAADEITVRRATEADAEAYRDIRLEALQAHPEAFSAAYEVEAARSLDVWQTRLRSHARSDSMLAFAQLGDRLVGLTGIFRGASAKTRHSAMIFSVYVRPEARGRGVGRQLIQACLAWAAEQGITVVKLAVVTTNTAAISLYAACGFQVYGIEPQAILWNGVYYDELLMVYNLTNRPDRS